MFTAARAHQFRQHRQRDLGRGHRADFDACRAVNAIELSRIDPGAGQAFFQAGYFLAACDHRDVGCVARKRGLDSAAVMLALGGDDDEIAANPGKVARVANLVRQVAGNRVGAGQGHREAEMHGQVTQVVRCC